MKFRNKKTGEVVDFSPCLINSALLSAQNRQRYYWANWKITQPEDRKLVLSDILESDVVDRNKAHCLDANYFKGGNLKSYFEKNRRQLVFNVNDNNRVKSITENKDGYRPHRGDVRKTGISELGRIYKAGAKVHTLTTSHQPKLSLNDDINNLQYRKLTTVECCRLQGVPDNYFKVSSNTQAYKMLGNGWQCDTIEHIFNCLFDGES